MTQAPGQFPLASQVTGDAVTGFLIWYADDAGRTVYGTRLGTQNGVTVCAGPEPMGPFVDDYRTHDQPAVEAALAGWGMTPLMVAIDGDFYADCSADVPSVLLAVTPDATQRVGFKLISSPNVVESCRKFGPGDN